MPYARQNFGALVFFYTNDGWQIYFALCPRIIEGKFVWLRLAERYVEGCNYGTFYVYRLRGSKQKRWRDAMSDAMDRARTVLDDLADLAD
jgi:hypothetical protein